MMQLNTIHQGDALELARQLDDNSIHCIVTSPPYWGLRDYGTATWQGGSSECDHQVGRFEYSVSDKQKSNTASAGHQARHTCPKCGAIRIDNQLGLEPTPEEYIAKMVELFGELRRALHPSGTLWLNMGDSYASQGGPLKEGGDFNAIMGGKPEWQDYQKSRKAPKGLKPKDLIGMPWRLALALQADGWYLRSDIIWSKPNPMPESVTDRPTKAHEYIFLMTKSARYYYDAEAIKEKSDRGGEIVPLGEKSLSKGQAAGANVKPSGNGKASYVVSPSYRNRRTVWTVATQPYPEAHFATFPPKLIEPCILAGSSAKGACPECGNPWERVVEKSAYKPEVVEVGDRNVDSSRGDKTRKLNGKSQEWIDSQASITTTGWRPTCDHDHEPIPATVLDPFMGSGTTAQVAIKHHRAWLGFELSADYIALAEKRISGVQMTLFA